MKTNVIDTLKDRGYIKQIVFEEELYEMLSKESVRFYIGFDPTADSLHVGHFLAMMAMAHMQRAGHRPVALLGGGTGRIGDPSGRTDMRKVLTEKDVDHNIECFRKQMSRFFSFEGNNAAIMVNNADWLLDLNYIDFIRDIGAHFSVNKMLTAECFKSRMEKGLSFLEFNYMLMQSYDFLYLYENYDCKLQCGGDDQWSNILAGADLIRRKIQKPAFAMTFELLTTSEGIKMGKTQKGALWLDENKTTPYEFFQYWRNISDEDVEKCFKLLTFLSLEEISKIVPKLDDEKTWHNSTYEKTINTAKEKLAYEITKVVHGDEKAINSLKQAKAAFGSQDKDDMPQKTLPKGITNIIDILENLELIKSRGEGRRLIQGNGIKINDRIVESHEDEITGDELNSFILHKGKKIHINVTVK